MAVIARWKARLRAWLINIVREAIRAERALQIQRNISLQKPSAVVPRGTKPASKPETNLSEPSFERSEAEALQAQEKYYEPVR